MAKCLACEHNEAAAGDWLCDACNKDIEEPSYGYLFTNKEGEQVWTDDFEESIGE